MKYLVSGKEMRQIDNNTSTVHKMPELVLMEQAAMAFANKIIDKYFDKKIIVVCGCGNNGADGLAIARLLNMHGLATTVFLCSEYYNLLDKESDSFKAQKEIYKSYSFDIKKELPNFDQYDIIIDAIFGVGLNRTVLEPFNTLFEKINSESRYVIAVDIASGIDSDNGNLLGAAIKCNETYTFAYCKLGQILWPGCDYSGELIELWIGIDSYSWLDKKPKYASLDMDDLKMLPTRVAHSNKGTFGKVLLFAGMNDMAGAACLSCKAAYKSGAGLVKVITTDNNKSVIQSIIPEALVKGVADTITDEEIIKELLWADSIVFGPGMGCNELTLRLLELVLQNATVPVVIDADGLNILSENMKLLEDRKCEVVLTPHLKEMSRLCKESVEYIQHNIISVATDMANLHDVVCVLKDFRTVIASPYGMTYINLSGNNGMATGGSGDVLSGIIGALIASRMKISEAAPCGVLIHGLAGDMISNRTGFHGMLASDIIEGLNLVWKQVENNV